LRCQPEEEKPGRKPHLDTRLLSWVDFLPGWVC